MNYRLPEITDLCYTACFYKRRQRVLEEKLLSGEDTTQLVINVEDLLHELYISATHLHTVNCFTIIR